MVTGFHLPK